MAKQYIRIDSDGDKYYYKDPKMTILHREDGPAIEYFSNGDKMWYANGEIHRLDGPALEFNYGSNQWFVNDVFIFETKRVDPGKIKGRMKEK